MAGTEEYERSKVRARRVLASLPGIPLEHLRALAQALGLAGPPLEGFGTAIASAVMDLEDGELLPGWLAELQMGVALSTIARSPRCEALLERLEDVDAAPWAQLREALLETRAAQPRPGVA